MVITSWVGLEYERRDSWLFCSCRNQGGVLVLRTPNMNFHRIRMRLSPWIGRREGRNIFLDAALHLSGFSPHMIRILVQNAGFKEIEISTGVPPQGWKGFVWTYKKCLIYFCENYLFSDSPQGAIKLFNADFSKKTVISERR